MTEIALQERIKKFMDSALKRISSKDYDSAIEKLKAAEVLDRDNPEILYNLGVCYCRKELYYTSIEYFNRLIDLPYTFVDIVMVNKLLSYSFLMIGNIEEARTYINNGLRQSRMDTALLNMLGYSLEREKKYDEAMNAYREIVEIDKYNYNAYNSLAYIITENNRDLNEALMYAKIALESDPENPAYLDTIGCIYMKKGQTEIAKNYLKKALLKLPDSMEIKSHINQLLKIDKSRQ